jgi:flagellar assembly protein FliH
MQTGGHPIIEVFEYAPFPGPSPEPAWISFGESRSLADEAVSAERSATVDEGECGRCEQRIAEESRRSFDAGRERGFEEGRHAEREAQNAWRDAEEKRRTSQVSELIQKFAEDRDNYFYAVEHEVVDLALAVAARILRREAQMDPLLLTGAVRVALGQLSKTNQVRLRVPETELSLWTEAIEHIPNLAVRPIVLAGEGMCLGDCVIETELGSVDLGIRAQLSELEYGFFDRLERGGVRAATGNIAGTQEAQR